MRSLTALACLLMFTLPALADPPVLGPNRLLINSNTSGLEVKRTDSSGNEYVDGIDHAGVEFSASSLNIHSATEITVSSQVSGSFAYTVVRSDGKCLIVKRPRTEPAPSIVRIDESGDYQVIVTPQDGQMCCGTVSHADYSDVTLTCEASTCSECSCTECSTEPCPPPPPPPPPPGDPCAGYGMDYVGWLWCAYINYPVVDLDMDPWIVD